MANSSFFKSSGTTATTETTIAAQVDSATTSATNASNSATSASDSATAAANSATAAATSATNASSSATSASTSATTATTQAGTATTQATNAASSATTATTKANTATTQASNAATSASGASTSATNASNSATAAATSATNASNSATAAASSATSASGSATTATTKASEASTSASTATTKASEASTSATNASDSASTATTKASEASTSATNAASSATSATSSASTATTKASEASTSATNAANSATASANSATASANSATAAANSASSIGDLDSLSDVTITSVADNQILVYDSSSSKFVNETPASSSSAADDITTGDAAVTIATTTGNITLDAQGNNTDIILKGTKDTVDTTFLTISPSNAGIATFGSGIIAGDSILSRKVGATKLTAHSDTNTNPTSSLEIQRGANDTWGADIYTDWKIENGYGSSGSDGGNLRLLKGYNGATTTRLEWDAQTGGVTFSDPLTVGVDDTGHDVKFFGATSGKYLLWDESADQLDIVGNARINNEQILHSGNSLGGVKLATITISSDATVEFSSTYITDTYDTYEVILKDIHPSDDNTVLKMRMGIVGSGIVSGSQMYDAFTHHRRVGLSQKSETGYYGNQTLIYLHDDDGNVNMGTGADEKITLRLRFHNLRSTSLYKTVSMVDGFGWAQDGNHMHTYESYLGMLVNNSDKVETLQFFSSVGTLATGTATLYGYNYG